MAPELDRVREALGRRALTAIAREVIAEARRRVKDGEAVPPLQTLLVEVEARAGHRLRAGLARVINATGVLLHTNLGRAPLPAASIEAISATAGGYSTLELDAVLGERTRRGVAVERSLAELSGAEDALLVNNNAAGVLLSLSTLGAGREVIVSRGELVEIGGGFRIPEVLARSGALLVEVGTTNRTRIEDYASAIGERTACVLRVHPSNFKMTGFSERPSLASLARLARERGVPLVKDLGGGLLVDLGENVTGDEPTVQACVSAGADLVCFSLDKLFGGPQMGAIVGRQKLCARLRADPLARALRVDKLGIAALAPILGAYTSGRIEGIPIHAMIRAPVERLRERVEGWQKALGQGASRTRVVETIAAIGGGTLAEAPVRSVGLCVSTSDPDSLARKLRHAPVPIIARIEEGQVVLDARSVFPAEDSLLGRALGELLRSGLEDA